MHGCSRFLVPGLDWWHELYKGFEFRYGPGLLIGGNELRSASFVSFTQDVTQAMRHREYDVDGSEEWYEGVWNTG